MGTLRFFEEVVSFKIRRTFGFADYTGKTFHFPGVSFLHTSEDSLHRLRSTCVMQCAAP